MGGKGICSACLSTAPDLLAFLSSLSLSERDRPIAAPILTELQGKIETLCAIGLDRVVLNRECTTP